ncbi:MAG TPA: glycerol-3-phosphate 1-O-acyltransferase PlsY [Candidatus Bilophila faecipullorum]|uniref:Glycerol-3-phosphate acyltransferase n=2 Tax=Bilophila TaxID=35832 RepID=A0A9D1R243_9BACT|nr:glycerol-3-phosphate 1-O-acyltransferase PlsY [uncultured Bilophila sp.]HIW79445.1 glycerol-3-phosphate 1-O-acyltransferase PlsY [Candidatus Bilophila faecipullorum]
MFFDILWIAITYCIGSVPFGLVFAKTFCHIDPRTAGSGNVGATNVSRLCGTGWGVATLACDLLKGALPVAIIMHYSGSELAWTLTALAAILGHLYSCFLGFKGGKAVATSIGVLIPLAFWQLLAAVVLCLLLIWRSGFVSLGSLALVTAMPILLALSGKFSLLPLSLIILGLVYWSHRENIRRLARGEEKTWIKKK